MSKRRMSKRRERLKIWVGKGNGPWTTRRGRRVASVVLTRPRVYKDQDEPRYRYWIWKVSDEGEVVAEGKAGWADRGRRDALEWMKARESECECKCHDGGKVPATPEAWCELCGCP